MNSLIIVESPNKIKKIQEFLNSFESKKNSFKVIASFGHIRDLKKYGTQLRLGIDLETMNPQYVVLKDKKTVVDAINKEASKAKNIFLATDPDREGEAIAWHISEIIKDKQDKNIYRIIFNEITKQAIIEAINFPKKIDENLVQSQESRRMLDRIIGFRLSYLAQKKLSSKSAGRVKSCALKLIIDRENEINAFIPEYWWTIVGEINEHLFLKNVNDSYKKIEYSSEEEANEVLKKLTNNFIFKKRLEKKVIVKKPKPLEMATFLIGAYNQYGLSNQQAIIAAQSLYEKGLITYPRTDSTRISSKDFISEISNYIEKEYGKKYYSLYEQSTGNKIQDAHEALRPTSILDKVENISDLTDIEKKVYEFIWKTTLKAFLIDGVNLVIYDIYDNNSYSFLLKQSVIFEPGYRIIDGEKKSKFSSEAIQEIVLNNDKIYVKKNSTHPKPRYNQASIIKKLKNVGVGRPSTYGTIVSGLLKYDYIEKSNSHLLPTKDGIEVNNLLTEFFGDIINETYTSQVEEYLDQISLGELDGKKFLLEFWKEFEPRINVVDESVERKTPEFVNKKCPNCDGELIYKKSRFGKFIGCINYPDCKYIEKINGNTFTPIKINQKCSKCNKGELIIRKSKFNTYFIACENYPKCKYIMEKQIAAPIIKENLNNYDIDNLNKK